MAVSINSNLSPVSLPGIRNSERSGSAVAEPQSPGDSYQTSTPTDSFLDFKPYRNGVSVAQTGAPVPAGFSPINAQDAKQVRDVVQSVRDHLPGDGHVEAVAEKRFLGDATAVNRYTRVGPLSEKNRLNVDGAKGRTWAAGDVVVERADHTLVRTHTNPARGERRDETSRFDSKNQIMPDNFTVTVVHPDGSGYKSASLQNGPLQRKPGSSLLDAYQERVDQFECERLQGPSGRQGN